MTFKLTVVPWQQRGRVQALGVFLVLALLAVVSLSLAFSNNTDVVTETRYEDGNLTTLQDTQYVGGTTTVEGGTEYRDTVVGKEGESSYGNLFGDGEGGGYDGSGLFDGEGGSGGLPDGGEESSGEDGPEELEGSEGFPIYPRLDASSFGDVHLSTFDGLRFDCMAAGHFLLLTSLEDPSFQVQALYSTKARPGKASWTTGVAVSGIDGEAPTVQISTPKSLDEDGDDPPGMFELGGCPIDMYVDGEPASLDDGITGLVEVYASKSKGGADRIAVRHPATDFTVDVDVRISRGTFGCFLSAHVTVPGDYRADETLLGLLGTRNVTENDWVTRDGTPLPVPEDRYERLEKPAYDYCVENWGIRVEGESIFAYGPGESFGDMDKLDAEYDGADLRDVSEELAGLCGDNLE